jgi:hypothetical protein
MEWQPGYLAGDPTTHAYRLGYAIGYHVGWLIHSHRQG